MTFSRRSAAGPAFPWAAWWSATRPKTLAASVTPVIVGSAFAWRDDSFLLAAAGAALLGALLIQVGTNLANDYYDHRRGADAPNRFGPPRAAASGLLSAPRILAVALACFALSAGVGLYLVYLAGWPILVVGLLSIASGYAYTGGPYPLGYHGWGDLFVFVFFGFVAVAGTYYVQAGPAPLDVLAAGAAVGALSTAVLVVNNLRDLDTDRFVGKRTLAVLLGPAATRAEYSILLAIALIVPVSLFVSGRASPLVLLPLLCLPWAASLALALLRTQEPRRLNPLLVRTTQLLFVYGLLFAVGVVV